MDTPKPIHTKDQNDRLPYRLRERFLSTPELALLHTLQEMVGMDIGGIEIHIEDIDVDEEPEAKAA